jgi:hypothetical protein
MRRHVTKTGGALAALLVGTVLMLWSAVSFAGTPTLGADCGTGAAIVGSDTAGKVTVGQDVATCTLTFSAAQVDAPACTATNETNSGGHAVSFGVRTTTTTMEMDGTYPWAAGDVVSYLCLDY